MPDGKHRNRPCGLTWRPAFGTQRTTWGEARTGTLAADRVVPLEAYRAELVEKRPQGAALGSRKTSRRYPLRTPFGPRAAVARRGETACGAAQVSGGSEFLGGIIIRCPAIQAHNRKGWIKRS